MCIKLFTAHACILFYNRQLYLYLCTHVGRKSRHMWYNFPHTLLRENNAFVSHTLRHIRTCNKFNPATAALENEGWGGWGGWLRNIPDLSYHQRQCHRPMRGLGFDYLPGRASASLNWRGVWGFGRIFLLFGRLHLTGARTLWPCSGDERGREWRPVICHG